MDSIDVSRATTPIAGALIYEYRPEITQVVEYGASADAVLSGQAPPAEGARFDFYLEGPASGPKLEGTFRGVDYIYFRADGRAELHVHGEITTRTGRGWRWKREAWRFRRKALRSSSFASMFP